MKKCKKCDKNKQLSSFYGNSRGGHLSKCVACYSKISKADYENHRDSRMSRGRERQQEVKKLVIGKYSNHGGCVCCGITELSFLSLDHIRDNGAKDRRENEYHSGLYYRLMKLNYPNGYQALCHNCQWGKRIKKGFCPHHPTIDLRKM